MRKKDGFTSNILNKTSFCYPGIVRDRELCQRWWKRILSLTGLKGRYWQADTIDIFLVIRAIRIRMPQCESKWEIPL